MGLLIEKIYPVLFCIPSALVPTTLIDPQLDRSDSPEVDHVQNICQALSHMSDLHFS